MPSSQNQITFAILSEYTRLLELGYSQRKASIIMGIPRRTLERNLEKSTVFPIKTGNKSRLVVKSLDIETSPSLYAAFGRFNQNFSQDNVVSEGGKVLAACVKTLGSQEVRRYFIQDPEERYNGDDYHVVTSLACEINDADVIIGHNIKGFDIPTLRARLVYHNLPDIRKVRVVDTLQIAKKLRFNSNRLDSLGAYLGLGRKNRHEGITLWLRVMEGNEEALKEMLEYCEQDTRLVENIYMKTRAFDSSAPNLPLMLATGDTPRCPVCASARLIELGSTYTSVSEYQEYECQDCGHKSRGRKNLADRSKLLRS